MAAPTSAASLTSLESRLQAASDETIIPGAVIAAADRNGNLNYAKAFGFRSLKEDPKPPCDLDTVMALFSATKLITTIAALQLVEKGLISLGDDVGAVLPELAALPVLKGVSDGKVDLQPRRSTITLRHLLTHSSGLSYTFMSPLLLKYNRAIGQPEFTPPSTVLESYNTPLIFEPGTSWSYGTGLDWAGLLISRLTKTPLEEHFEKSIFAPLNIEDITFWPNRKPDIQARLASLSIRDKSPPEGTGKAVPFLGPNMMQAVQEELAGQGLHASSPSYLKILKSILLDDEQLLKKETAAQMFEPQLTAASREALQAIYRSQPPSGPCSIGYFPPDAHYDWGLGGLLTLQDVGYRRKGCLTWSGMPNLYWFIDREAGVCGLYGGQLMPAGDKHLRDLIKTFEATMYGQAGHHSLL